MVVTRSQAATAQAAAEAALQATIQDPEPHDNMTAIVEVPSSATSPTLIQVVPDAEDQLANLAERCLAHTQALAGEHVMLKFQQEGLNQAQQAALVAVQGYAESGLNELANRQLVIVQEFQGALASTRSTFQEQMTRLQDLYADLGAKLEGQVNKSLALVVQDLQRDSQSALQAHTDGANQIERTVNAKVEAGFKEMNDRVQQQIVEQLTSRLGSNPAKDVEQLVLKSTADVESQIRGTLELHLEEMLTSKLDSYNEVNINENVNELMQKLVETSVSNMAHRLEQSLDLRLDQIRQETKRRVDSKFSSNDTTAEDIQQLVTQETTRLVRQAESRMQKVVTAARADMNLQVQRQADAISILREQLQQRQPRVEGVSNMDTLERKLKEFIVDEVARQVDLIQLPPTDDEMGQHFANLVGSELARVLDERQIRPSVENASDSAEIKRSVESSIHSIISTVRDAVNQATLLEAGTDGGRARDTIQEGDTDADDDYGLSEEDRQMQQKMREALVQTQEVECKEHIKGEQTSGSSVRLTSAAADDIQERSSVPREDRLSARQNPSNGHRGNLRRDGHRLGLRATSARIQNQVAKRAEASAQRYDSRS